MKKLIALLLSLVLCLGIVPAIGAETTNEAEAPSAVMTDAEREARISALSSYYDRLYEMKQAYGIKDAYKNSDDPYANARIIVKSAAKLDYTGSVAYVNGYNDLHVIQYRTPAEAEAAAAEYAKLDCVEYVQADGIVSAGDVEVKGDVGPDDEPGGGYNFMSWGWGVNYANARDFNTWIYDLADNDMANLPTITVAVIDTGVDSDHPILVSRLVSGGYDFIDNDDNPEDEHGHGTHCSGTIIDGTLPNVKIMGIRVLDEGGYGDDSGVAAGMEWAYLHGCQVGSMSLGGDCDHGEYHNLYNDIVEEAAQYNFVFCIAAGNESEDANLHCPGNVPLAITVASHTSSNSLSWFSNYGDLIDITAPGSDIVSARMGGGTTTMSGTSMATPHVSAVAAMLKSYDPDMSVADVTNIIKANALPASFSGGGAGLLCCTNILKFYGLGTGDTPISFNSNAPYAWTMDIDTGIAHSGNAGVDSSSSILTGTATTKAFQEISFEYNVSSDTADQLQFMVGSNTVLTASATDGWTTFSCVVPGSGDNTFTWKYVKDASGAAGDDCAYLRNVEIHDTISTVINAPGNCYEFISTGDYPWVIDGDAVKSGNAGVNNSVSVMTTSATLPEGVMINFNYKVDAGSGDSFTFKINGQTYIDTNSTDGFVNFLYQIPADGTYNLEFTFTKDGSGASGSDCAWVKEFALGHTMNSALNVPGGNLEFTSPSQSYPWVVVNDYLMSGNAEHHSTTSYFELTIELEEGDTLSFDYKVSSEANYDKFYFYVNGSAAFEQSGEIAWTHYTFTAAASRTYTFKWAYTKDSSVNRNDDAAYVDNVELVRINTGLLGDVNGDGVVDLIDASLLARYVLGLADQSALDLSVADVDGNGEIDLIDVVSIMRMVLDIA